MLWIFGIIGLLLVVALALVMIGRETERLAASPRPAVFDIHEAVDWIADRLSPGAQGRLTHDDVHRILYLDTMLFEDITRDPTEGPYPWVRVDEPDDEDPDDRTVDEDIAIARLLAAAEDEGLDLTDADIAEVLEVRNDYLRAIGAIGTVVDDPDVDADGDP